MPDVAFDSSDHDLGLAPMGHRQAQALAERLAGQPLDHIFCSPFRRTIESVIPLARQSGILIRIEWGLCEFLKEDWFDGFPELPTVAERHQEFPEVDPHYQSQVQPLYPETKEELSARVAMTVEKLVHHFGNHILLMGHGASVLGVHRAFRGSSEGCQCTFCGLWEYIRKDDFWEPIHEDGLCHLTSKGLLVEG
jgi:broad specificity phosphatase PhoE